MARWETGEKLGFGKFGVVYACRDEADPSAEFPSAIKRLQTDMAQVEQVRKRFAREIQILADLSHENVMPVIDSGTTTRDIPWFVMPRALAGSLKDAIEDGRVQDREWTIGVFTGMLEGMGHAHAAGVLHRDLKPGNVLLFGDSPKVSDFGVAKQIDLDGTTLTLTAQELGTLRYIAPEQIADAKRAGPPADVFAFGKILTHMLTTRRPEPGRVDLTDVPEEFRYFIDKCCRDNPDRRYPDAGAALVAFNKLLVPAQQALPPDDAAKQLVESAASALGTSREEEALDELQEHFRAYPDEPVMFRREFARMPSTLTRAWIAHDRDGFTEALENYDRHAAENSSFGYGDVSPTSMRPCLA